MSAKVTRPRERVPTGRRGRPSKSMIAAALERPFCAYLHKICLNNRLEGHKYCMDHIMNDKTAPYRQCTYVHSIGRRCSRAAHKVERKVSPLCLYHASLQQRKDPPIELPSIEDIAARHNNADSDTESVDDNSNIFNHASVYTEEELNKILRDKMIKLRRLYIEQYGHTQYLLKEKRLKYIQAQRTEDEIFGEMYSYRNYRDSPDYKKLHAMLVYHKTFGPESLLQEQAKRRKMTLFHRLHHHHHSNQNTSVQTDSQQENICIYSKTSQGCDKPCIPFSPYCRQHILYDSKQVLFRPCAGGVPPCLTPVVSFTRKNKCWLHTAIN